MCGKKIGHTGLPFFWRVKVERYVLDIEACRRQQGLGMMLGGTLAQVLGPDEDLAKKILCAEITLCEDCAMEPHCVFELAEAGEDMRGSEEGAVQ